MKANINLPYKIITAAVFIILIIPVLFQDGMFMDGQQYACVSKNMAEGRGSFWNPHLSDTWWKAGSNDFMEHPPLVFGIQSLFFRIFGDSIYTERIFSLFTALLGLYLLVKIWKTLFQKDNKFYALWWLPVFLWLLFPVVSWSYQNNLLENTMLVFDLLAVWFILKFLFSTKAWFYLIFAGISIFAAFLSKGIPGIFPLVIIPLYGIIYRDKCFKHYLKSSLSLIFILLLIFLLFYQNETAGESIRFYFKNRLLGRIEDSPTVNNRFYILGELVKNLAVPFFISMGVVMVTIKKYRNKIINKKIILFFFLTALSASLPLILTSVQRSFYLMPSTPFFAIALALLCANPVSKLINHPFLVKNKNSVLIISFVLLFISIFSSYFVFKQKGRHHKLLEDIYQSGDYLKENTKIKVSERIYANWAFQMYMIRHYNISVSPAVKNSKWFISVKDEFPEETEKYTEIENKFNLIKIYKIPKGNRSE